MLPSDLDAAEPSAVAAFDAIFRDAGPLPFIPHVRDVPGVRLSDWEERARPWEREARRSAAWWFDQATSWAAAAVSLSDTGHVHGAERMGGYAVACRRRGEAEAAIAARRSAPTMSDFTWRELLADMVGARRAAEEAGVLGRGGGSGGVADVG